MYHVITLILLYIIFTCVSPCDLMYDKDYEKVYLCDASKDIPNQCNVFWKNNFISFCALETIPPNVSSQNLTVLYNTTTSFLQMVNATLLVATNVSYKTLLKNATENMSFALNKTYNDTTYNETYNETYNKTYNDTTYNETYNKTYNDTTYNETYIKTYNDTTYNKYNNVTYNKTYNNKTTYNNSALTNNITNKTELQNNISNNYYSYYSSGANTAPNGHTNSVLINFFIIFLLLFMFAIISYLGRKKFLKKKHSIAQNKLSENKFVKKETFEKVAKEPRPTLKNRSLSMPDKEQPFRKWKKNPFLSRKDTLLNIDKNIDNCLNEENILTQSVSLEDIIFKAPPSKLTSQKEPKNESENVLEECEILLSSIRDDDFKDVEEENDLPLPPVIPPFTNQNRLNQNEHV